MEKLRKGANILCSSKKFIAVFEHSSKFILDNNILHAYISKCLYSPNTWLPSTLKPNDIPEARLLTDKVFAHFKKDTNTRSLKKEDKISEATLEAIKHKSNNGLSLLSVYQVNNRLKHIYWINLSYHETRKIIIKKLQDSRVLQDYNSNTAPYKITHAFFSTLTNVKEFKEMYLTNTHSGKAQTLNECRIHEFCIKHKVQIKPYNWKILMYLLLTKQQKLENNHMPADHPETTSTLNAELHLTQKDVGFNKVVTTSIVHTVNEKDVKSMSKQDLFNCAVTLEESIKYLKVLKNKSTAVKTEIKCQKKVLKTVISYLDSK